MGVTYDRRGGNLLVIKVGDRATGAYVDWDDNVVMVPLVNGIDREVLAAAIKTYWPTVESILWPEDVEVLEGRLA